jgi:carbamoyl-phosphate synthase small subunit
MAILRGTSGYLLLEDGASFPGEEFYGSDATFGEAVFNTSHSGYQEICTDPSYCRQIMVFTAAHIGNVGVNNEDVESDRIHVSGVVVRNLSPYPRNWRSQGDFTTWLKRSNVPLLAGADTRAVTLHLRQSGAMRSGIFPATIPLSSALEQVKASMDMVGADLAREVSCIESYKFLRPEPESPWYHHSDAGNSLKVAVLDCGVKRNILRLLTHQGCHVTVLPAQTTAKTILKGNYNGLLLSNGPGDPAAVHHAIATVRQLLGKVPIYGICLGHQILSLAAGMETYKLPFGHRGSNHPVRRVQDQVVEITSQNHGFAVSPDGLGAGWRVTHVNLNDGTIEGLEHPEYQAFSIQYHPEASPGPHDSLIYFNRFIQEMRRAQAK